MADRLILYKQMQKKLNIAKRVPSLVKAFSFKQEMFVLYYSITDSRTPILSKLVAFAALLYLISPIDLIPDFIPILGYVDDIVIAPLLLHIAFRLLPADVKASGMEKAKKHIVALRIAFVIIILLLLSILIGIFFLLHSALQHLF